MCNIVTEFYLYSIVYIYLINSRLDVTFSVRHHFHMKLYHGVRLVVRFSLKIGFLREFYSDPNSHIAFQEAYQEDFKYSDFFRDHKLQSLHIGDVRREFICCGLDSGLEKAFKSKSSTTSTELQTEVRKFRTLLKAIKSRFRYILVFL